LNASVRNCLNVTIPIWIRLATILIQVNDASWFDEVVNYYGTLHRLKMVVRIVCGLVAES